VTTTQPSRVDDGAPTRGGPVVVGGGYRAFLDGLRVVAVYLVVVFHSGSDRFVGGFVGVDVFFVLSGFLVTQLLLRDVVGSGGVGFGRFYARRFRRLLPAAFVVLVVTALVVSALASPVEVADAEGAFRAAFLYVTNWYFIGEATDYFGGDLATNPVLHFWSLAVEEQFYLLWPLLLGGLFAVGGRFGDRQVVVVRAVVAVGAVVSLGWAWSLRSSDPIRGYYGTDARAYQLLAGALIALCPGVLGWAGRFVAPARVAAGVGLVGLVVVASSWVGFDAIGRGMAVTVVTVVVIVALEAAGGGGVAVRVLSAPAVVYLGKISYGTYLWHWPVIWVMARSFDLSVLTTIAVTCLVATGLASLSFQLLEHPIRISGVLDRHRGPVIAAGLAISVVSALVIIPGITDRADPAAATPGGPELATTGFTPVPTDLDYDAIQADFPFPWGCYGKPTSACTIGEGTGPHLLLLGDSHARMLIPTFEAIAEQEGLTFSASVGDACPWQRDLHVSTQSAAKRQACEDARADTYDRVVPDLDPDVIVAVNRGYEAVPVSVGGRQYVGPDRGVLEHPSAAFDAWLEQTTLAAVDDLLAQVGEVVLLEPIPYPRDNADVLTCLSEESVLEACRFVVDPGPSSVELLYRRLDDGDDRLWSLDIDRLVCPFLPICDPIVDQRVVRIDQSHLTRDYAGTLVPPVTELLQSTGILPAISP
jgi:peptidoglycan/LPS O-acetylase OafA/YrhL